MNTQFFLTLTAAIFISGIAGYLGTLMLSKKMSVVAGPLSHLALPGVALAILYDFSIALGAFPFVILGSLFIWLLEKRTKLPLENLSAIIFAFGVGTALLFLPMNKAEEALVGNISRITLLETMVSVFLSFLVFIILQKIYNQIMLTNIYEDLALIEGIKINRNALLYLLGIAITVGLGVYLVGGLITVALIALPSASAKNLSRDLHSYKILAPIFGIVSAVIGIAIASSLHLPTGPMIIIFGSILFLLTVILRRQSF